MRALLVRHGQSLGNADPPAVPSSTHGDELTDLGREQADTLARSLEDSGVTDLITSPMRRARETAEAIGARLGLEPEIDEQIHELRTHPEMEPFEEIAAARVRSWRDSPAATKTARRWSSPTGSSSASC